MQIQCISSVIILLLMVTVNGTSNSSLFSVGTVLFRPSDTSRHCWTQENIALLTGRMLMANLMPHADYLKADDDSFTTDIIEYFRLLLETIRQNTEGKTKHLMLMAATDAIGGYMTHLILPISKYSFYAGNIQYASIMRLYQLYDELKHFLRTNGNGWAKPWKNAGRHIQAKAISMQYPAPTSDACKGLIYHKQFTKPRCAKSCNSKLKPKSCVHIEVPMPFFDSKTHPAAIAVPFRSFGLRNLESHVSAYVLVKYFVAVSKCMASRNSDDEDVHKFNSNIFQFVVRKVIPHLGDEKFYAAFGGVLRILQTVTEATKEKGMVMGNFNIMPESLDKDAADSLVLNDEEEMGVNKNVYHSNRSRNNLIVLAALATIVVWFCLGAAFVCCRIKAGQMKKQEYDDENTCNELNCPKLVDQYTSATSSDNDFKHTKIHYNIKQIHPKLTPSKASKKSVKSKGSKSLGGSKNTNATYGDYSGSDKSPISQTRSQSFITTSTYGSPRRAQTLQPDRSSPNLRTPQSPHKSSSKKVNQPARRQNDYSTKKSTPKRTETPTHRLNSTKEVFISRITPGTSRMSPRSQQHSSMSPRSPVASRSSLHLPRSPRSSPKSSGTSQKSRQTSETSQTPRPPQIQVHSVQYYPPTFACHTSMVGKIKPNESTDDSRESTKRPYIFGYDFQTSSEETTPRGNITDGENDVGGNMSK